MSGGLVFLSLSEFSTVYKVDVDVFLELSCFFNDPVDVGNLISGSSTVSKSSLNMWKFMVHMLLKPGLENFEHYFASMWDESNMETYIAAAAAAKSLQSCPTLCDPIDSSPPGSPVPRILQARTLEWVAISFSNAWKWKVKGIFQARVLEWGATAFSGKLTLPYVKYIGNGSFLYAWGNSNRGSVTTQRGGMGREMGGGFKK